MNVTLVIVDILVLLIVFLYIYLYYHFFKQRSIVILALVLSLFTIAMNIEVTHGYNTYPILFSPIELGLLTTLCIRVLIKRPLLPAISSRVTKTIFIVILVSTVLLIASSIALLVFLPMGSR